MLTEEEVRRCLKIDKHSLDEDCIIHSDIFMQIADTYAEKVSIRDLKKEKLGRTKAELDIEYRNKAKEEGEKLTESKLEQRILVDKKYIDISMDYYNTKHEADKWGVLKESFRERGSMLKILCDLYISGYFSKITEGSLKVSAIDIKSKKVKKLKRSKFKSISNRYKN